MQKVQLLELPKPFTHLEGKDKLDGNDDFESDRAPSPTLPLPSLASYSVDGDNTNAKALYMNAIDLYKTNEEEKKGKG